MSEKQQTAVEWLVDKLLKGEFINDTDYLIEQSKEMEKEQIEKTFKQAQECAVKADGVYFKYESFEQFKKKQNETNSSRMD
jgi:hypothetical protein